MESIPVDSVDCVCVLVVSAAPEPIAVARSKRSDQRQSDRQQSDRQVTKPVRLSEADIDRQTLTDVQHSAVSDIKTVNIATLTDSDLKSN